MKLKLDESNYTSWNTKSVNFKGYTTYSSIVKDRRSYSLYAMDTEYLIDNFYKFKFQLTTVNPYDEAEYVWCKMDNGIVKFIHNGKVIDKMTLSNPLDFIDSEDEDYVYDMVDTWFKETILQCIDYLYDYNKDIKSIQAIY